MDRKRGDKVEVSSGFYFSLPIPQNCSQHKSCLRQHFFTARQVFADKMDSDRVRSPHNSHFNFFFPCTESQEVGEQCSSGCSLSLLPLFSSLPSSSSPISSRSPLPIFSLTGLERHYLQRLTGGGGGGGVGVALVPNPRNDRS